MDALPPRRLFARKTRARARRGAPAAIPNRKNSSLRANSCQKFRFCELFGAVESESARARQLEHPIGRVRKGIRKIINWLAGRNAESLDE